MHDDHVQIQIAIGHLSLRRRPKKQCKYMRSICIRYCYPTKVYTLDYPACCPYIPLFQNEAAICCTGKPVSANSMAGRRTSSIDSWNLIVKYSKDPKISTYLNVNFANQCIACIYRGKSLSGFSNLCKYI